MVDGIYYNSEQFFRFYKDGTFLDVLIKGAGDRKLVAGWLKKENPPSGVIKGRFTCKNNVIAFSTPGHFGDGRMIDYTRKINGNKEIVFESLDHNNGHRMKNGKFIRLI